jgi:hypothetical protein
MMPSRAQGAILLEQNLKVSTLSDRQFRSALQQPLDIQLDRAKELQDAVVQLVDDLTRFLGGLDYPDVEQAQRIFQPDQ